MHGLTEQWVCKCVHLFVLVFLYQHNVTYLLPNKDNENIKVGGYGGTNSELIIKLSQ